RSLALVSLMRWWLSARRIEPTDDTSVGLLALSGAAGDGRRDVGGGDTGLVVRDGTDFEGAPAVLPNLARRLDCRSERLALHDVEAEQLLFRFGERAVDDEGLGARAQRRSAYRRHQAHRRAEPPFGAELALQRLVFRERFRVLLRAHVQQRLFGAVD